MMAMPFIDGSASCTAMHSYSSGQTMKRSCSLSSYLTGKAELLYEVLLDDVKTSLEVAVAALRDWLQPAQHAALASAQLMRQKQNSQESVDNYVQCFEQLFKRSYGTRKGMDNESKSLLKRDFFTQNLLRKWQEKILPSALTFHDVLFHAHAAEEHKHTLSELHGNSPPKSNLPHSTSLPPKRTYRQNDGDAVSTNSSQSWQ